MPLLVLVQERDVEGIGRRCEHRHPAQHLVTMVGRVAAFGWVEREQPEVGRMKGIRHEKSATETHQVCVEILVDADLADRRPDARHRDPVCGQNVTGLGQLVIAEVTDVDAPGAAELDLADAQFGQNLTLTDEVGVDLVREARQRPHL